MKHLSLIHTHLDIFENLSSYIFEKSSCWKNVCEKFQATSDAVQRKLLMKIVSVRSQGELSIGIGQGDQTQHVFGKPQKCTQYRTF